MQRRPRGVHAAYEDKCAADIWARTSTALSNDHGSAPGLNAPARGTTTGGDVSCSQHLGVARLPSSLSAGTLRGPIEFLS